MASFYASHTPDGLDQLATLDIDGASVVALLADSLDGDHAATGTLARHGIAWDGETLTLDTTSPALGKLLLSPLLREPGARLDVDSGLLSVPLLSASAPVDIDGGGGVYLVIADSARLKSHPFSAEKMANIGRFLGEMRSDEEMKSLIIARKPYWPSASAPVDIDGGEVLEADAAFTGESV